MTIKEQLRANFPNTIDKSKQTFSALICNDNNTGAIQAELEDVKSYMAEWTGTPSIYDQEGTLLDKTLKFFSYLTKFNEESDKSIKNRIRALYIRNNDTKWGSPSNLINVFNAYFPTANIYIAENTNEDDETLVEDGDFELRHGWIINNCEYSSDARFIKTIGVKINNAAASVTQTVSLDTEKQTTYFLHLFQKGKTQVRISANSKYWNYQTETWQDESVTNLLNCTEWKDQSLFFIVPANTTTVTIEFLGVDTTETYIDYVRLFEKKLNGSFTVYVQYEGSSSQNSLALAGGTSDPNDPEHTEEERKIRYDNYGYFEQSFLTGVAAGFAQDVYNDLLNYLRAVGVKGYLKIVTKDSL